MNRYKMIMDQAQPPAHLQDDVMTRLDKLRTKSAHQVFRVKKHRPASTAIKILAGSLAAVVAAGAIVVAPLMVPSASESSGDSAGGMSSSSLADQFGLALYADAAEGGQTIEVVTGDKGIIPFGGMGFPGPSELSYQLNLTCVGQGIKSVTYAIEGEDVRFVLTNMKTLEDGTLAPDVTSYAQKFTLDYDNQQPEDLYRSIDVDLRSPEERDLQARMQEVATRMKAESDPAKREALEEEMHSLDNEQVRRENEAEKAFPLDTEAGNAALDKLFYDAEYEAAQKIGRATLSATATFTDGTTLTRRYHISPVEDFNQVFADRMAADREEGRSDDDPRLTAPLFKIVEVP